GVAGDPGGVAGAAVGGGAFRPAFAGAGARAAGRHLAADLAANDGHSLFAALGTQVVTGPTLTNVNDFRAIVIDR
ncbi:MAG: MOFRL family protein, partial [Pseudomonadota bacterium]|nr:MOFRL family protein [Pseudomonadota bacterium]